MSLYRRGRSICVYLDGDQGPPSRFPPFARTIYASVDVFTVTLPQFTQVTGETLVYTRRIIYGERNKPRSIKYKLSYIVGYKFEDITEADAGFTIIFSFSLSPSNDIEEYFFSLLKSLKTSIPAFRMRN